MAVLENVPAPAKLNLYLRILGRRDDGYHYLQTLFCFLDLVDIFRFERTTGGDIELSSEGQAVDLSAGQDLVLRAARALQQASGTRFGARIHYHKHIPAGAGLGGGSSNAATTLIALNRLWGTGLRRPQLLQLARGLGADVAVFVFGRAARAAGIGDLLQACPVPAKAYWLLNPGMPVSTAEIFQAYARQMHPPVLDAPPVTGRVPLPDDGGDEPWPNDLEPVACARYPALARLLQALRSQGLAARMTGSGATVFVQFDDLKTAKMHSHRFISKMHTLVHGVAADSWLCQGISEHPLWAWVPD